jgi:hypothetical protein
LYSSNSSPPMPIPATGWDNTDTSYVYRLNYSNVLMQVQSCTICLFVTNFFHLASILIHVVACVWISFFKAEQYSITHIFHILFIDSSTVGQLGYFYLWAIVNNAMKWVFKYFFETLFSIILGIYPRWNCQIR